MKVSRRKLLGWGAGFSVTALGLDALAYEPRHLRFEPVTIPIRDLPLSFEGYRIAFITDIHVPKRISRAFVHEAIAMAHGFRPDVLLFGGDFVDAPLKGGGAPSLAGYFESASAPDGVFGVLGNHDWWTDGHAVARDLEKNSPIQLLENHNVRLRRNGEEIALAGIEDLWCRDPDLTRALGGIPASMPRVVLSHNPDTAEECKGHGRVDLQLSGHTHGGEVVIPFYGPPFLPSNYGRKYEQGLVEGKLHLVYVARGICRPRAIRFRCRPEVTGITLTRA